MARLGADAQSARRGVRCPAWNRAGLSLGLSFACSAAFPALAPLEEGAELIGNLFYPIGFLLVIGGRYQLFTENTLTPVTLVLTGRCSAWMLLRLWGVVMTANVIGAALAALVLAHTSIFTPEGTQVAHETARHAIEGAWGGLFWKGVFAGWLVASIVWLVHAAQEAVLRFLVVFVIIYAIPAGGFEHCIIGACETLYLVFSGDASLGPFLKCFTAVAAGNVAGGVLLVAVLNYAQTQDEEAPERREAKESAP